MSAPVSHTYRIRQKTDFSWVKSLMPEPGTKQKSQVSPALQSTPKTDHLLQSIWEPHLLKPRHPKWADGMGQWNCRRSPHPGEPGILRSRPHGTHPACSAARRPLAQKCRQFGLSGRRPPRRRYPERDGESQRRVRSRGERAGGLSKRVRGTLTWLRSVYSDVICSSSSRV